MKKYIGIIAVFALLFASCEKDETEGVSTETTYATFTMNGDRYVSIVKGETFTDPGVTAKEGESDLEVTVSGAVDASKVGTYDLVYSATNQDGFSGNTIRTVIVLPSAEEEGVDISGKYKYMGSGNYTAEIEKVGPGFYTVNNVWGPNDIPAYIITADGKNLILPVRSTGYGRVEGTGTINGIDLEYSLNLLDQPGIPDGTVRKWQKL